MKSETLTEAHARLKSMSDAEKEGAAAASEGQLQPLRNPALDERAAQLDEGDQARLGQLEAISRGGGDMILAGTQDVEVDPNWAMTAHQNTREGKFGQSAPRAAASGGDASREGVRSDSTRAAASRTSATKKSGKRAAARA
jgi:hypothetical protein